MTETAPLVVTRHPHWVELCLTRPPRNVLDRPTLEALVAALDELAPQAPLLLISATGRHFSTGYSVGEIPEEIFHRDPAVRASHPFEQVMEKLVRYPAPVVAAVQGDAWGGAVELLACTDLRVAASGVRLGVPPVRLGLVYSHTGLRRMLRGFGSALLREMVLTGEPIPAKRAREAGFFNRVVPQADLAGAATELLEKMARNGPQALRGTRRILMLLEEAEVLPDNVLDEIAELRHRSWSSEEFTGARDAFLEGRTSPFASRDDT